MAQRLSAGPELADRAFAGTDDHDRLVHPFAVIIAEAENSRLLDRLGTARSWPGAYDEMEQSCEQCTQAGRDQDRSPIVPKPVPGFLEEREPARAALHF